MTTLYLNDLKVYQHFGRNPAKGRRFPHLGIQQSACGVRWQAKRWFNPKTGEGGVVKDANGNVIMQIKPHKMQTCAVVSLTKTKEHGFWEVHCDPRFKEEVELWLIDNCR